jgi:hypothetical protein
MAESSFIGYLIEIGLKKYEKTILPLEQGEDEAAFEAADSLKGPRAGNDPPGFPLRKAGRKKL